MLAFGMRNGLMTLGESIYDYSVQRLHPTRKYSQVYYVTELSELANVGEERIILKNVYTMSVVKL